jgi:hypothetical protein
MFILYVFFGIESLQKHSKNYRYWLESALFVPAVWVLSEGFSW